MAVSRQVRFCVRSSLGRVEVTGNSRGPVGSRRDSLRITAPGTGMRRASIEAAPRTLAPASAKARRSRHRSSVLVRRDLRRRARRGGRHAPGAQGRRRASTRDDGFGPAPPAQGRGDVRRGVTCRHRCRGQKPQGIRSGPGGPSECATIRRQDFLDRRPGGLTPIDATEGTGRDPVPDRGALAEMAGARLALSGRGWRHPPPA